MRAVLLALFLLLPAPAAAADPAVVVWYRGTPAGTPRQEDLAVIRALGFHGVTWPASQTAGLDQLKAMAGKIGLQVSVAPPAKPMSAASLLTKMTRCDLIVDTRHPEALTAMAWRAIAHGARIIAFDAGAPQGAGLEEDDKDRTLKPWAREALKLARQLTVNPRLINAFGPGPGVIVSPDLSPALDIMLLDADRSWVVIATNASAAPVESVVRLPAGAPYAIWLDLLDGSTLAMVGESAGPRWNLKLPPWAARVYVIDKVMK